MRERLLGFIGGGRVAAHVLIYLGSAALNALIPFLLLPFIVRWLGPAEFGIVGSFVAIATMLILFVGLNSHGLVNVVYYQEGPDSMPPQAGAAVGIGTVLAVLLLIGALAGGRWVEAETGISASMLWTVVVAAYGQFLITVALVVAQATRAPLRYASIQLGYGASLAVFALVLLGPFHMGWEGRALAQVAAALLLSAGAMLWLTRSRLIDWRVRKWPVRNALAFGLPLLPHSIATVVMASVDRLALGSASAPSAVGHYFLAYQLASILLVFATAVNQAWQPWLYERLARGDAAALNQVMKAVLGSVGFLALGAAAIALLAPVIVPIVAGPNFRESILPLQLLAPAFACQASFFIFSAFIYYQRQTALISAITVSTAILQVTLVFSFVRYGGPAGVAAGVLIASVLYAVVVAIFAQRAFPLPWRSVVARPA